MKLLSKSLVAGGLLLASSFALADSGAHFTNSTSKVFMPSCTDTTTPTVTLTPIPVVPGIPVTIAWSTLTGTFKVQPNDVLQCNFIAGIGGPTAYTATITLSSDGTQGSVTNLTAKGSDYKVTVDPQDSGFHSDFNITIANAS